MTTPERLAPLVGARLRRIDLPEPSLLAITLLLEPTPGSHLERVLIASFSRASPGLGLLAERPRGAPASAYCQLLRKHLLGSVITGILTDATAPLGLALRRGPERRALVLDAGRLELDVEGRKLRAPSLEEPVAPTRWRLPEAATLEALEDAGEALLRARAASAGEHEDAALLRALRKLAKKLEQRLAAVRRDRARGEAIPTLRLHASLLLAHLASIERGASLVTLTEPGSDPPLEHAIALDPSLDVRVQIDALFERARKLERGDARSGERLAQTASLLERTHHLTDAIALERASEGERAEARALVLGELRASRSSGPRGDEAPRLPYRRLLGAGEREIRVGRSARDNDALTTKHAAPHDLWLHARGVRGAHVVVPLQRGEACPPPLLVDAATLAAHFSDATHERVVEVDYAARGHVRKRKGMAPGQVEIDHPKTIAVRMEPERLARLLRGARAS